MLALRVFFSFCLLGDFGLLFPSHFIKQLYFCALEGDFSSCLWGGQLLK